MLLGLPVGGVAIGPHGFIADDIASYRPRTAYGVLRQHIPERPDAVLICRYVVESGVGEVEADIHQAYHHILACKGPMTGSWGVGWQDVDDAGRRVETDTGPLAGFDAMDCRVFRQGRQSV